MLETRTHQISREFKQPTATVFAALITPSQIRGWWSASRAIVIPKTGGIWCATWGENEDEPDYISSATIEVFEPDRLYYPANLHFPNRGCFQCFQLAGP